MSPRGARGTFPGTVYQFGNLLASSNLTIQALIAAQYALGGAAAVSEPTPGLDKRALRAGRTPDKPVNAED